jgi:hypothetical protein
MARDWEEVITFIQTERVGMNSQSKAKKVDSAPAPDAAAERPAGVPEDAKTRPARKPEDAPQPKPAEQPAQAAAGESGDPFA